MPPRAEICWQKVKNLTFDYSQHSTVHGINYIAEKNRSWCERAWWIAAFCASVLGCAKLIFDAWQINPLIITFASKPTAIWQIPFPAITVCPTIPTDLQNLRNIIYAGHFGDIPLNTVSMEERDQLIALKSFCPDKIGFVDQNNLTNCNGCLETLRKIAIPMDQMFFECKYQGLVINCKDHLQEVGMQQGICYTFNGLEIYRRIKEVHTVKEWTIDEGYAPRTPMNVYPHRASGTGPKFGLTMLLGYHKKAMKPLCEKKTGYWVEYRMQYDVPRFITRHVTAAVGNSLTIIIDPKLMKTTEALRAYSTTERKCFFSDERHLKYFQQYTQSNCEAECEADKVLEKCGCLLKFIEDRGKYDTCGPSHEVCTLTEIEEVQFFNHLGCNCLPSCTSIAYESQVLISGLNATDLVRTHNINQKDYAFTKLSIFFNRNQLLTSQRTELYGLTDFLADCGGLLGLFLGASVISFMEFIYFCILRIWFIKVTIPDAAKPCQNSKGFLKVLRRLNADYFEKTTIHGLKYIANRKLQRWERLWWALVVVISVFCCGSLISHILQRYKLAPVTINLATDETPITKIPFPALTVCPQMSVDHIEEIYHYFKIENHSIYDADQDFADSVTALAHICDPAVFGDLDPENRTTCDSCSKSLLKMAVSLQDFVEECESTGLNPCLDIFKDVVTEQGVCFTYNRLNVYRKQNDSGQEDTIFDSFDWTLEGGYNSNASLWDIFPLPGSKFSVTMLFNVLKTMNQQVCRGPVQGIKLFIHLPYETPQIAGHYFLLPYDHITQISINPKMITSSPELRQVSVEKRQCYFSDERYLFFFRYYTQNNCEIECLVNVTLKKCGCLGFHLPRVPDVKYCGISDIPCYRSVSQLDFMNSTAPNQSSACECLPTCTSISYDAEINQIFSKEFMTDVDPELLEPYDMAAITVGFKESQFVALQRSLLYGKTEFVANFGSLISLFLGFSFMSVVELVYFCTIRLFCNLMKKQ